MDWIAVVLLFFFLCVWPLIGVAVGIFITKYRVRLIKKNMDE